MKTANITSLRFAVAAGILSLSAFITYSWKTITGDNHPNISSWAVWSFLTILNFTSYKKITGHWAASILPTLNAMMTLVVLLIAFKTGTWEHLTTLDHACLIIGMTAGTLWWIRNSAEAAQGVLQVAIFVAFIPTFKNAYLFPDLESWIPWLLWTLCFVAQFYSVKYSNPKNYIQYLYPVCGTVWHMIVFGLTLR